MSRQVFVCPHCGQTSQTVNYSCTRTEWMIERGSYDGSDHEDSGNPDYQDSDTQDYEYTCEHCNHAVHRRAVDDCFFEENSEEMQEAIAEATGEEYEAPYKAVSNE